MWLLNTWTKRGLLNLQCWGLETNWEEKDFLNRSDIITFFAQLFFWTSQKDNFASSLD